MKAFFTELPGLLEQISSRYEYINQGGCGVFAMAGWLALRKVGVKASIWYVGWKWYRQFSDRRSRYEFAKQSEFKHFVLEVGGTFFDSDGVHGRFDEALKSMRGKYGWGAESMIRITPGMLAMFMRCRTWNPDFTQPKSLRKTVTKLFTKIGGTSNEKCKKQNRVPVLVREGGADTGDGKPAGRKRSGRVGRTAS